MSGSSESRPNLDAVDVTTTTPPPASPDAQTREEKQDAEHLREMTKAGYRATFIGEREVKRLEDLLNASNKERLALQKDVLNLGPKNALLTQAIRDMRGNFSVAAILMTIGGFAVSYAGATSDTVWKSIALVAGVSTFIIGFLLTLYTCFWIRPIKSTESEPSS